MGQGSLGNSRPLKGSVDLLMLGAVVVGSRLLGKAWEQEGRPGKEAGREQRC